MRADRVLVCAALGLASTAAACAGTSNAPPPPPVVAPLASALALPSASASAVAPRPATHADVAAYEAACARGELVACTRLGALLLGDPAVPRDEVRAIGLLTRACDGSIGSACTALGAIYFDGEHEDLPRAYVAFERACHGGDLLGCASQAILLHHGKGTPRDADRARALYEKACDGGVAFACTGLGQSLLERGPASDRAAARKDFERGCTDAFPAGCFALGTQCAADAFDEPCPAEPPLRRACDQGFAKACAALEKPARR